MMREEVSGREPREYVAAEDLRAGDPVVLGKDGRLYREAPPQLRMENGYTLVMPRGNEVDRFRGMGDPDPSFFEKRTVIERGQLDPGGDAVEYPVFEISENQRGRNFRSVNLGEASPEEAHVTGCGCFEIIVRFTPGEK